MCEFHFSEYVVLIVYVEATAEVQYLNTYRTYKCIFSNEKSHWRYSHSSESYETHSVLTGNTKCECWVCVWKMGVSQSWLEEVMPCNEADLRVPALLPYVSELLMLPWQQPLHHPLTSPSRLRIHLPQGNPFFWCSQPLWWSSKNMKGLITQFIIKDMS